MKISKAIIVAAGRGRRLGPNTAEIPKCMVPVAGRPILHWQMRALEAAQIDELVMVRGYLGDRIAPARPGVRFVENPAWPENNILASLLYAAHELDGGFVFSYSDIVYAPAVAKRLVDFVATAAASGPQTDVALVVDRRWQDSYLGRTEHPVGEAELARVESGEAGDRVTRVGKQAVPAEEAAGEFIGLAWFSSAGADALRQVWNQALAQGGLEAPFGRAPTLRQAYLTDALNAMVQTGACLRPVFIDGQWREIDTSQDLARAEAAVPSWG